MMNNSTIMNKKDKKKFNNVDNNLTTQPVKSIEEELQEITNLLNKQNSFVEFYDRKIEELTKMNAELLSEYYSKRNIIETYNNVKKIGAIKVFGSDIFLSVGYAELSLFVILAFAEEIASLVYKAPEIANILFKALLCFGGAVLPISIVSGLVFSPLAAKINKSKYEELNMTEEDVEVIKKKVDKNKSQIEKLKNIKYEIIDTIKQLKDTYINKKFEAEENKKLSTTESIEFENTYESTYVDSYDDIIMSSYSCASAPKKTKKLEKIRK